MKAFSATALTVLLFYSIAVLFVRERWAFTVFQLGVFLLAAAWLILAPLRRRPFPGIAVLVPMTAVLAWGALQLAAGQTVYRWKTWLFLLDWLTFLAAAFVALRAFEPWDLRHRFLRAVAWFSLVLSVVATLQMFTAQGKVYWLFPSGYPDFVLGPFVSRNQYAAFIELLLPIVLWQALADRRRALLGWVTAGIMLASVVAGASRAGSILVALEIPLFFAIALAQRRVSAREAGLAAAWLLAFAGVFTAVVGWQVLWKRLQLPDPLAGRREILWSSLDMIRASPAWGCGLGTWSVAYPRYARFDDGTFVNQAHDDWLQWAAEGGVPLLAIMLSLALLVLRPAIRSLWGLGVLFVLAHATVDYPLQQRPAFAAWFFVLAAIIVQADRQRQRA